MKETSAIDKLQSVKHNPRDPSPWLALYLDTSVPFHPNAKANILLDVSSRSRQFFLPLVRPFCRLSICCFKVQDFLAQRAEFILALASLDLSRPALVRLAVGRVSQRDAVPVGRWEPGGRGRPEG